MLKSHLENLEYIASVQKLEIEHIVKKGLDDFTAKMYEENHEIKPTTPWSILAPKTKHNIYASSILEEESIAEIESQHLQIGVDYIIGADDDSDDNEEQSEEKEIVSSENTQVSTTVQKVKSNTILTFKTN